VFVHGYNVDGQQARGWQAEMFKRMYWSGNRSRFWGVDWYGSDSQFFDLVTVNYQINVQHAIKTAPAFGLFLNKKMQGPVSIAAHSLGNMLVSSALSDQVGENGQSQPLTANVTKVFMIDAAVATEAFTGGTIPTAYDASNKMVHPDWYGYKPTLGASEWFRLFENDHIGTEPDERKNLTWRNRFKNLPTAIHYYNFYSSGEDVLAEHEGVPGLIDVISEGGRTVWAQQEKLKGKMLRGSILSSRYGGWGFNWVNYAETVVNPVTDETIERIWLPSRANSIAEVDLKTVPFFKGSSAFGNLFSSMGPGNSVVKQQRDKWLAEAFPALTGAAGGPEGTQLDNLNLGAFKAVDMQATLTNGWPQERIDREIEGWRHSDIREVSYLYTYPLFDVFFNPLGATP